MDLGCSCNLQRNVLLTVNSCLCTLTLHLFYCRLSKINSFLLFLGNLILKFGLFPIFKQLVQIAESQSYGLWWLSWWKVIGWIALKHSWPSRLVLDRIWSLIRNRQIINVQIYQYIHMISIIHYMCIINAITLYSQIWHWFQ